MSFYTDLVANLRACAAANVNMLLALRREKREPIGPEDVLCVAKADGRWFVRVRAPEGSWLDNYRAGDVCPSEVEALCAFIEGAQRDVELADGEPPNHLLEQAREDAEALAVYRTLAEQLLHGVLRGTLDALNKLDLVSEASFAGGPQHALEQVLAETWEVRDG